MAEATLIAVGARMSCYTGQLVRWVDLTKNETSEFFNLALAPTALDFEQGNVVTPEEVPAVPGKAKELRNRG